MTPPPTNEGSYGTLLDLFSEQNIFDGKKPMGLILAFFNKIKKRQNLHAFIEKKKILYRMQFIQTSLLLI
jgi:hypothetical protein